MKLFDFIKRLWTKEIRPVFIYTRSIQDSINAIELLGLPAGGIFCVGYVFPPHQNSHFAKDTNLYVFNVHLKRQRKCNEPMYVIGAINEHYIDSSWFLSDIDCDVYALNNDGKIVLVDISDLSNTNLEKEVKK
jgi:hypothetical protein